MSVSTTPSMYVVESLLPGGAPNTRRSIVTSAVWLLNAVKTGSSMKTVRGRALRGSVTGLSPRAVIVAETASIASVKMPAISCTLRSFNAEQLVHSTQGHQRWSCHVTKRRVTVSSCATFPVQPRSIKCRSKQGSTVRDGRKTVVVTSLHATPETPRVRSCDTSR